MHVEEEILCSRVATDRSISVYELMKRAGRPCMHMAALTSDIRSTHTAYTYLRTYILHVHQWQTFNHPCML